MLPYPIPNLSGETPNVDRDFRGRPMFLLMNSMGDSRELGEKKNTTSLMRCARPVLREDFFLLWAK